MLYSPGGSADGALDDGLVEDLVGHGYVVVTMDDTNESPEVEFPGGRLVTATFAPDTNAEALEAQQIRAADASFTLNELSVLNHGGNPDAEHAPLPAGLAGSLNLSQVGMFGWSLGGGASAQAMHDDPRIKAAINMDGTFWGPLAQEGVNRPFLLLTGSEHTEQIDPTLASFLAASTGPKLHLALADSKHRTFSDGEELEPELAPELGLTPTRSRRWSAPSTRRPPSPTSAPTSRRSSASTCAAVTTTCSTARRRASPTSRSSPDHPDSQR